MTITYLWEIESLDCIPSIKNKLKVVSCVHWRINATDGTNNTTIYGAQSINYDENATFLSYDSLNKDMVVSWTQESMGIDAVTKLQETLDKQLERLANPPVISIPLPWSK